MFIYIVSKREALCVLHIIYTNKNYNIKWKSIILKEMKRFYVV